MAGTNTKGSTGNQGGRDDDARLMDAFAARTGATDDAIDPTLDDDLQQELAAYVALSRRIAAVDDVPVAPSVRGAILSEAARVGAERAAQPRNGLVEMLLAMLRPGPVLAFGALAAIALAISVRQEPTVAGDAAGPSMQAMKSAPTPSEAVAMAPSPAPTPPADEAAGAAAAPAEAPDEAKPAAAEAGEAAAAAAAANDAARGAAERQAKTEEASKRVVELAVADARDEATAPEAKPVPRPSKTIAAEPASLGPIAAADDNEGLHAPAGKAAAPAAAANRPAEVAANEDSFNKVLPGSARLDNELRETSTQVAMRKREDMVDAALAKGGASATTRDAVAPSPKAASYASKGGGSAAEAEAAAAPEPARDEAKALATKDAAAKEVAAAKPAPAQAPAPAPVVASKTATVAAPTTIDRLRKAVASATSSEERVRLLEKLVAALDQEGRKAEASQARTDLAEARASLAGAASKAKAAPERAKASAPTSKD